MLIAALKILGWCAMVSGAFLACRGIGAWCRTLPEPDDVHFIDEPPCEEGCPVGEGLAWLAIVLLLGGLLLSYGIERPEVGTPLTRAETNHSNPTSSM